MTDDVRRMRPLRIEDHVRKRKRGTVGYLPPRLVFGTVHSSFWKPQCSELEHNMLETVAELNPSELTF